MTLLGISLSHDASAVLTSSDGKLIAALAEERISRKKNHIGIPFEAIRILTEKAEVSRIYIGSHLGLDRASALSMACEADGNPSNPTGVFARPYPGFEKLIGEKFPDSSPHRIIESTLENFFANQGLVFPNKFSWVNHHDSHAGSALGVQHRKTALIFSLDGSGDGESGLVAHYDPETGMKVLTRIPALDSLGELYSAVTRRYNFRANRHEGKITGLAAYGHQTQIVENLLRYIDIKNGVPVLAITKAEWKKIAKRRVARQIFSNLALDHDDIINKSCIDVYEYADLAFAIQEVLERSVLEIIDYWISKTGVRTIQLAGGVFSNVKLNQRISELKSVKEVWVFPNMGDGGLSVGGIWHSLASTGKLSEENLFADMYLGPENVQNEESRNLNDPNLVIENISQEKVAARAAKDIASNRIVAIHIGKMEFGPRALGNRSILLDPRNSEIILQANQRLRRTEFMPFAPVVSEEYVNEYFSIEGKNSQPFYYMTMTCQVKKEAQGILPAITHVDGSARPQIINQKINPMLYKIIDEFRKLTGVACLVNTSLNIHEEPINFVLDDSIRALKLNSIDVLYTSSKRISLT
jgi:carbamoyltransferase